MIILSSSAWLRVTAVFPVATSSYFIVTVVMSSVPVSTSFAVAPVAEAVTRFAVVARLAAAG
jgi:hypothetical protein